jgi:O-antigen ligase
MNQILKETFSKCNYLNSYLVCLLPIALLAGSLVSNIIVVLICLIFLFDIIKNRKDFLFKDKNIYFLISINLYLIFSAIFVAQNLESTIKAIGFIRFIILSYAICYCFNFFHKKIIKFWALIFFIVSIDILIEFYFGKNLFGFSSAYYGRIASFTGDELKIGGFYFGFIFLCLSVFFDHNKRLFIILTAVFLVIALLIGERSNFLKIFIMYLFFYIFYFNISYLKKIFFLFSITLISLIIVYNIPLLKSKFYNQIFNQFIIAQSNNNDLNLQKLIKENQHLSQYNIAVSMIRENPIFGIGFKNYRNESFKEKYTKNKIKVGGSTHPHQLHFEILSELGIIGYLLIISNLIYIITRKFKPNENSLYVYGKIFIIVSLIPILPSGSFFTSYGATIFFINYSFLLRSYNLR